MSNRLQTISTQISPSPNDPVICLAVRTPLTRARRGALATATIEDLLVPLFKVAASKVNPADIGDILIGNCLAPGSAQLSVRMAALIAGIPDTVPCASLNRQCSSGLQTVACVAAAISAGHYEVGIAGGVESMSTYSMAGMVKPELISDAIFEHEGARNVMIPMGITSENVATNFGISREKQDLMAAESHAKAARAQAQGLFESEIVPVVVKDPKIRLFKRSPVSARPSNPAAPPQRATPRRRRMARQWFC
jgi:acetyl-CoA acyltransferase 1